MVRDFQDAHAGRSQLRGNEAFDVGADVAGQEERDVVVNDLHHHRVVVANLLPLPLRRRRMQDADTGGASRDLFAGAAEGDDAPVPERRGEKLA